MLRRPADHQTRDEHGNDSKDQDSVQAPTGTTGRDLTQHHVQERHGTTEAGVAVMEAVHRAGVSVVPAANAAESGTPNRVSVPSVLAPTAVGTVPWCPPLEHGQQNHAGHRENRHDRHNRPALTAVADHDAESARQRERDT
jgi:hypothetical protein